MTERADLDGTGDAPREAVDAVCRSPAFDASDRLRALLVYLMQNASEAGIDQRSIARDVLKLSADFDPGTDAHVRVEVSRLRKALDLYYAACPPADGLRVVIPKGCYVPKLAPAARRTTATKAWPSRSEGQGVGILVCVAPDENHKSAETGAHCLAQTIRTLTTYPLVRSGLIWTAQSECVRDTALDQARRIGCHFIVELRTFSSEDQWRSFVTVVDAGRASVLWCRGFEAAGGAFALADQTGLEAARAIADPVEGVIPRAVSGSVGSSVLDAAMLAYGYMRTQRRELATDAYHALNSLRLDDGREGDALPMALAADMLRVRTNYGGSDLDRGRAEALELAERAVDVDPGNATALLALGYARLADGDTRGAACVIPRLMETVDPIRPDWDICLLGRLTHVAASGGQYAIPFISERPNETFLVGQLHHVISQISAGDLVGALDRVEQSIELRNPWLHLFRAGLARANGQEAGWRQSVSRLNALLPDLDRVAPRMISSFFPELSMQELLRSYE